MYITCLKVQKLSLVHYELTQTNHESFLPQNFYCLLLLQADFYAPDIHSLECTYVYKLVLENT